MKQRLTSTLTVFAVMGLLALAGSCSIAHAHSLEVERCFARDKHVTKLGETVLPNGLLLEQYDTNNNGKPDVATLSTVQATRLQSGEIRIEHDSHPIFYLFNSDEDESTDKVFIDKVGKGKCKDIVLYHDFYAPQTPNAPDLDARREAGL